MNKTRVLATAISLGIAAFVGVPAAAQASPHWYKKHSLIGPAHVTVATSGTITFQYLGTTSKCKVTDSEEIWNPEKGGAGEDSMTSFSLSACKSKGGECQGPQLAPTGLPWASTLIVDPNGVIRDEIRRVLITVSCANIPRGLFVYEGTLTPEVGNGTLVFGGPQGGSLTEPSSRATMTVQGADKLKAPPGAIHAKNP